LLSGNTTTDGPPPPSGAERAIARHTTHDTPRSTALAPHPDVWYFARGQGPICSREPPQLDDSTHTHYDYRQVPCVSAHCSRAPHAQHAPPRPRSHISKASGSIPPSPFAVPLIVTSTRHGSEGLPIGTHTHAGTPSRLSTINARTAGAALATGAHQHPRPCPYGDHSMRAVRRRSGCCALTRRTLSWPWRSRGPCRCRPSRTRPRRSRRGRRSPRPRSTTWAREGSRDRRSRRARRRQPSS